MSQAVLEMEAPTMVITWPRDLLRQIESMARRRGVEADALVVEAVEQYLKQPEEVSKARTKLRELLKHMDTSEDMLETLREVRQKASETIEAHQDWFDVVAAGGATRKWHSPENKTEPMNESLP
ncbi:MAG: CopG family transcriptional regulator [Anaerolineae bacterium]|nr:CopG family transcriptional regulator [Anaerolineae bacterium]